MPRSGRRPSRLCLTCGVLTRGTRCPGCTQGASRARGRARDGGRPSSHARGYDRAHQALRAALAPTVEAGEAVCARCRHPIGAGEAWDLGHVPGDPTTHRGPEHRACNRSTNVAHDA